MQNKYLNGYEKKIMKIIMEEGGYSSIREIAKRTGMSWQTAKKYLERLKKREFLEEA
tara:strand:- start:841 stop:1011 length:171 start_codon:yes stop_codon:yes gene_type:complete